MVDNCLTGFLVGCAIHVEPVVQPDPEVDDPDDDHQRDGHDERELDERLPVLAFEHADARLRLEPLGPHPRATAPKPSSSH